jgi:predicted metalloprotease with PDZ domain
MVETNFKRGAKLIAAISMVAVLFTFPLSGRIAAQNATPTQLAPCPDLNIATEEPTRAATTEPTAAPTAAATTTITPTATPTIPPTPTQNPDAGFLGITALQVQKCGARIEAIKQGSPAEDARLQVGDVVVAINGKVITGLADLRNAVVNSKKGDKLVLTIQRRQTQVDITVTLGEIPRGTTATLPATQSARATAVATAAATPAP